MDAEQLRAILTVARDFKLKTLKVQDMEVDFHDMAFFTEIKAESVPKETPDADELMLLHIEKLKKAAQAGLID